MSLVTLEVDIDHGRVIPRGPETLPKKGAALLTLLPEFDGIVKDRSSISDFVVKWAGAFSAPHLSVADDDPRLAYLLEKHVK